MKKKFNWGIIGTGKIANVFANDLTNLTDHAIAAVGSRAISTANKFSSNFHGCSGYDNYSDLVSDPSIDGVYIATTK